MIAQHTPGPWKVGPENATDCYLPILCKVDGEEFVVAEVAYSDGFPPGEQGEANAAFIVRACNSHEELLAAVRAIVKATDDCRKNRCGSVEYWTSPALELARAAIAKATPRTDEDA